MCTLHARSILSEQCFLQVSVPGVILLGTQRLIECRSGSATFHGIRQFHYRGKADYLPNTQADDETHHILALHTNATHFATMTALRKRFFPARLNKVDAHVALFRALPGSQMDVLVKDLESITSQTPPFAIKTGNVFRFRKGVAVNVDDGGHSRGMYEALKKSWQNFLSKQDRSYKPHYTVANKLTTEQDVQDCLEAMRTDFQGSGGTVDGLALYRYNQGCWVDEKVFWFQGDRASDIRDITS